MAKSSIEVSSDAGNTTAGRRGPSLGVNAWIFTAVVVLLALYLAMPAGQPSTAVSDQRSKREALQAVIEEQCATFIGDAAPGAGKREARDTCDALRKDAATR